MIRSMTAFASVECETGQSTLAIELRAVNHRYLELGLRLPEELRGFEPRIRELIGARLARGKVDMTLRIRSIAAAPELRFDDELLSRLADAATRLGTSFPRLNVDFLSLLAWPGVLREQSVEVESLQRDALILLDRALDDMVATREREGARLAAFLRERLDAIENLVAQVRAHLPEVRAALRARVDARLADIKQPAEPGRIEQEIVMQLSRMDVDEELDRLSTHITEARRIFGLREAVGRRLDFLMQEFNREANTLGSKSADSHTTNAAVELKVLIEQMREQVQNLE
ncbi:MAG: YicC/YloC family endoribonuclease [Rhodanobacteraceae bacterium]